MEQSLQCPFGPDYEVAFRARRLIIAAHSARPPLAWSLERGLNMLRHPNQRRHAVARVAAFVLLIATLAARGVIATTFMSVEPIPGGDVVGEEKLAVIESAGYENLEAWSNKLLNECGMVQLTIDALTDHDAIRTVNGGNTSVVVAAGGFEGTTHPSFVFTIRDSGIDSVSAADVDVLDNALGYVLNQEGTAHFSPDNFKAYFFALDYAVVTFQGALDGVDAKAFFENLGEIDADLFSGQFAGFTQVAFQGSPLNNSMLFLKPAASKRRFISGLSSAADDSGAVYFPLKNNGEPTTMRAGIAFPGNDWITFREGEEYLSRLGTPSAQLLDALAALRQAHLDAVHDLVNAILSRQLPQYLGDQFACPTVE